MLAHRLLSNHTSHLTLFFNITATRLFFCVYSYSWNFSSPSFSSSSTVQIFLSLLKSMSRSPSSFPFPVSLPLSCCPHSLLRASESLSFPPFSRSLPSLSLSNSILNQSLEAFQGTGWQQSTARILRDPRGLAGSGGLLRVLGSLQWGWGSVYSKMLCPSQY